MTMCRINLVKGLGPVLQIAEGWTVDLPADVHQTCSTSAPDPTWPTHLVRAANLTGTGAFRDVYTVMNNWGANHGAISYGHIGADLITLASMLRIPVHMHNVPEEESSGPAPGQLWHRRPRRRGLPRLRQLRPALRAEVAQLAPPPGPSLRHRRGGGLVYRRGLAATGPPLERRMTGSVGRTTSRRGQRVRHGDRGAWPRRDDPSRTRAGQPPVRKGNVTMACGSSSNPTTATWSGTREAELLEGVPTPDGDEVVGGEERRRTWRYLGCTAAPWRDRSDREGTVQDRGAGRPASSTSAP